MPNNQTQHIICAWCQDVINQDPSGQEPMSALHSHGICDKCYRHMMGIPALSQEELNNLPFGVIVLNREGTVLSYNQTEADLSCLKVDAVLGKNFFTDVAPCTRVKEFKGRFDDLLKGIQDRQIFEFTFRFPSGEVPVQITLIRTGQDKALVNVRIIENLSPAQI